MDGIRVPAQQRGQDSLDRLLWAGAELLAEHGYAGFTLAQVSKRAGVSYGAMYWRIESKDALIGAIHKRFLQDAINLGEDLSPERWESKSLLATLEASIRTIAKVFAFNPRLLRALSLHTGADEETRTRATESVQEAGTIFCALLIPKLEEASHPDPSGAANLIFTVTHGAMSSRITWPGFHADEDIRWETYVDGLAAMAVALVKEQLPDQD